MSAVKDWYGSALGYNDDEIQKVYFSAAMLQDQVPENIPRATYDPISYRRVNGKVLARGEVLIDGHDIIVDFEPSMNPYTVVYNFLVALCDQLDIPVSENESINELLGKII